MDPLFETKPDRETPPEQHLNGTPRGLNAKRLHPRLVDDFESIGALPAAA